MAINLDFSGVDRPSFDPIPEDDYVLKVVDHSVKPAKNNPNALVAHCVFEVAGGEFEGKKVFHYQGLTGESLPFAKVMYEAIMGEPLDTGFDLEDEEDILGREFEAHVGQKPDNRDSTKMQNTIKYFILPFEVD